MNYPKDQPWAWKSAVGGFLIYFQLSTVITAYSISYDDVKTFYSVKPSTASLLFGILMGFRYLLGPVVVMIINLLGCDIVTVIAGCLLALGLFIASCSPNIFWFLFGYGFLVGIGLGMSYTSMSVILSELFDKRKSLAFGLSTLGFPLGYIINPHIFTFFYFQYGFRSAIMLLSAFSLHVVIAGLLFSVPKRVKEINEQQPLLANEKPISRQQKLKRTFQAFAQSNFNIKTFKNSNFVIYIIGASWYIMGVIPWSVYIVDVIHADGEITLKVAVLTFTVEGTSQIFTRIIAGILFDKIRKYRGIIVSLCCFISATVFSVIVIITPNIYFYLFLSLCRGLSTSIFFVQHIVILGDICSPDLLPMSIGIMNLFVGIGTICGPIISGAIRDRFSSYVETFLFLSAVQYLAAALILFVFIRRLVRHYSCCP